MVDVSRPPKRARNELPGIIAVLLVGILALSTGVLIVRYPWFRELVAVDDPTANPLSAVTLALVGLAWAACGLIVVTKTRNVVGWIAIAVGACLAPMWMGWSSWAIVMNGDDPGEWSRIAGDLFDYTWVPAVVLVVVVLPLVFPTGRPPGRLWSWVLVPAALAFVGGIAAVTEARQGWAPHSALQALSGFFADFAEPMPWALFGVPLLAGAIGSAASLVHRLRRGGVVERQQVKWVVLAMSVVGVVAVVGFLGPLDRFLRTPIGSLAVFATYVLIPLAIVVAILRYRLFDIDRLVSRTIGYSIVAGMSTALYFATVVVLRGLLPGGGPMPVAISTLAVAAAFQPLWRRVQGLVDRRFFRSRYDADQVIDRLLGELRSTLDPEAVATRTRAVVTDVFSPAHLGIWIASDSQSRQKVRTSATTPSTPRAANAAAASAASSSVSK